MLRNDALEWANNQEPKLLQDKCEELFDFRPSSSKPLTLIQLLRIYVKCTDGTKTLAYSDGKGYFTRLKTTDLFKDGSIFNTENAKVKIIQKPKS